MKRFLTTAITLVKQLRTRRSPTTRDRRVRLQLECLEERQLLSCDMTTLAQIMPIVPVQTHRGPTQLFLNFDGWTNYDQQGHNIHPFEEGLPQSVQDQDIQDILFRTSEIFAPFDVKVSRIYGDGFYNGLSGETAGNTTVFIGGNDINIHTTSNFPNGSPDTWFQKVTDSHAPGDYPSLNPTADWPYWKENDHPLNSDAFDIGYVDPMASAVGDVGSWYTAESNTQISADIAHEAGHTYGLAHVRTEGGVDLIDAAPTYSASNPPDLMSYDAPMTRFINQTFNMTSYNNNGFSTEYDDGTSVVWQGNKMTQQNSYTYLEYLLGDRPASDHFHVADGSTVDSSANAVSLWDNVTLGTTINGTIDRWGDYAVYSFTSPIKQGLRCSFQSTDTGSLNPVLMVHDSEGKLVGYSHNGLLQFEAQAGQTYQLIVGAWDAKSTGSFTLRTDSTILTINGDQIPGNPNDIITIDRAASGGVIVTVNGQVTQFDPGAVTSIIVNGRTGNDTINVERTSVPVTINLGNGTDTVNISPFARTLDNVQSTVIIHGGAATTVNMDDQNTADPSGLFTESLQHNDVTYTIQNGDLLRTNQVGTAFDPGSGQLFLTNIQFSDISRLVVNGGQSGNSFDVQGVADNTALQILGGAAADKLLFDDGNNRNTLSTTYTITQDNVTRVGVDSPGTSTFSQLSFPTHTASIDFGGIDSLTVDGGQSGNEFDVQAIAAGTPVTLYTGGGANQVIVGDSGNTLGQIADLLTIHAGTIFAPGGYNSLTLNDRGVVNTPTLQQAVAYTITDHSVVRADTQTSSFNYQLNQFTASAEIDFFGMGDMTIQGGGTGNSFDVQSSAATSSDWLYAGAGNNQITVGDAGNNLDKVRGTVRVFGEGGRNTLTVDDTAPRSPLLTLSNASFTITNQLVTHSIQEFDGTLSATRTTAVAYQGITSLTVNAGLAETVNVESISAPLEVFGGGNDVFNVSPAAQNLDNIQGNLTFHGTAGTSVTLNVDDQATQAATTWTRTPGSITRQRSDGTDQFLTQITYDNIANVVVNGGHGADTLKGHDAASAAWATLGLPLGGPSGDDEVMSIATDTAGNFYVTGHFNGTVDFDPGPGVDNLSSVSTSATFVAKYTFAGALVWVNQFSGNSASDTSDGTDVAVDSRGNVYVTGYFYGRINHNSTSSASAGQEDIFVTKLNSAGTVLWLDRFGGSGSDDGVALAVDASSNVYVTGWFQGTASIGRTLTSAGDYAAFVTKLNTNGVWQWTQQFGNDLGAGIAVDAAGNIYLTGAFNGTARFGTYTLQSAGGYDGFALKLSSAGQLLWVRQFGGSGDDGGNGIAVDAAGNIYTTGQFQGTAAFGSSISLTGAGSYDGFAAKLDKNGNFLWARDMGGSYVYASDATVDAAGNLYLAGWFDGTDSFGSTTLTSAGSDDGYVSKLDSAGNFLWTEQDGGTGSDGPYQVAVDGAGNIYAAGSFQGASNIDPNNSTFNLTSAGGFDGFVLQLSQAGPLSFTGLAQGASAGYTLRLQNGDVQIVDRASGAVLQSKALADTTSVTIRAATGVATRLTIDFSGGSFSIPVTFIGSTGTNTLVGPGGTNTWSITGANAGQIGNVTFSKVANLVGGSGLNTFQFQPNSSVSGRIQGAGTDWLDYSTFNAGVTVNLATGTASRVSGGVRGIQNIIGSSFADYLTGNAQGNILIGGAGNDTLTAGSGRSLLIGGLGSDILKGGSADDILIGGTTTYDQEIGHAGLTAILAEWQRTDLTYAQRIADLRQGGGLNGANALVWGTTVNDDGVADRMTGNLGLDWFFANRGPGGVLDTITDLNYGGTETIN